MRKRTQERNRLNVNVDTIEFIIQSNRLRGVVELTYNRYHNDQRQEGLKTRMVLISCWVNTNTGNAIKAHLVPNKRNPAHVRLIKDIENLGVVPAAGGSGMCLTTDGQFIRYGSKPGIDMRHYDSETRTEHYFFDSQAKALKRIIEEIGRYKTIGGLNLISLNRLPDTILIESGFEKIDDLLRERDAPRGIPMWLGSPEKAVGVQNEWRDRDGAEQTRRQFLDLLNKMLST